jgi:histidyl-tRNA synthetase
VPQFSAPRGTNDVLPADQPYWRLIRQTAERITARFGYQPIDIPIFEESGLFERGAGESSDIVRKELYRIEPRTEDAKRYALRPEPTAGIARAYIQHGLFNLPRPVKLWLIGPMLRYDRPQAGRVRQFSQFDIEALGESDPALDAEVIELLWRFYDELGLRDLTVLLNSIGDQNCRPAYIEELRAYYRPHLDELCADDRERFEKNPLRLFDCKEERCRPIMQAAPLLLDRLCEPCREHFARLRAYLTDLGIRFEVDPLLVRGLDYYTRTVFEFVPPNATQQGTVGAGGRYDGLVELLGGRPTPGIGFGTGIERIILNMKRSGAEPPPLPAAEVYVAHLGDAVREEAVKLASELRRAGIPTLLAFGDRSLKAQFRSAGATGANFVIVLGENELANGVVGLRDLRAHGQTDVPRSEIVGRLQEAIGE